MSHGKLDEYSALALMGLHLVDNKRPSKVVTSQSAARAAVLIAAIHSKLAKYSPGNFALSPFMEDATSIEQAMMNDIIGRKLSPREWLHKGVLGSKEAVGQAVSEGLLVTTRGVLGQIQYLPANLELAQTSTNVLVDAIEKSDRGNLRVDQLAIARLLQSAFLLPTSSTSPAEDDLGSLGDLAAITDLCIRFILDQRSWVRAGARVVRST